LDERKITWKSPKKSRKLATRSPPSEEKPPEQTEFTVILEAFDAAQKIPLVKVFREITGLGLKEAMAGINAVPFTVKEGVSKDEAAKIKAKLEEAGGKVTVK
jgi:large subunit ribosomal protein L7/L12